MVVRVIQIARLLIIILASSPQVGAVRPFLPAVAPA
jgi:hypothetical protein